MKKLFSLSILCLAACGGSDDGDDASPGGPVAGSVEETLPKLTVQGTTFRDAEGRVVFLRGANYSHRTKSKPYWSWQKPEHFEQLRGWGFNCVRYLLLWDAIEPKAGEIDQAYLDHVEQVLDWAAANGIYVLLDMHQDLYSGIFGGDGAPAWACVDNLNEPNLLLSPWFLTYFTPEVIASFNKLWSDAELQSHYVGSWKAVAERAKKHSNVLGYDLINEPFPGWKWPWDFEKNELSQFYAKVAAGIREVDAEAVVFVEPAALTANNGAPTWIQPPKDGPFAYAPHYYDPLLITGQGYAGKTLATVAFRVMSQQAAMMGGPLFVGEFGAHRDYAKSVEAMRDQCELMDSVLAAGWTYWDYNPDAGTNQPLEVDGMSLIDGGVEHPAMDHLVRPYPRAAAGTPKSMLFDPVAGTFTLTLVDADASKPTLIHLPKRHFPAFTVEGTAAWEFDAGPSVLSVWAGGAATITVKRAQ